MPDTRIVIDGLWQCLCPSFRPVALSKAIGAPLALPHRPKATRSACLSASRERRRSLYATIYRSGDGWRRRPKQEEHPLPRAVQDLIESKEPYPELAGAHTQDINNALHELREREGSYHKIMAFVTHLVTNLGRERTPFMYETLLRASCSKDGSAEGVRQLLAAMKTEGVEGTSAMYHAALRALAVHPDYLALSYVLKTMKEHWIDLTPDGAQSVAISLLRAGQYELALDKLEEMTAQGDHVAPWVLDLFIYTFATLGFHDEALKLVSHRLLREEDHVSLNVWYFLLDACGRAYHHAGVKYVWARMVQPRMLNPTDAMCLDFLNTAARAGDPGLARQAMDHLAGRGAKLGLHHFEALIDAYASAGDVTNAFQALCIMQAAGVTPETGSTRALFLALTRHPDRHAPALQTLYELRKRYAVPLAAVNVLIEALLESRATEIAMDLYRSMRRLCGTGPDAATFAILLRELDEPRIVIFLGHEMGAFQVRPSAEMLDPLIRAHATDGSHELGMKFLRNLIEMGAGGDDPAAGPWMSEKTAAAVVVRCFREEDKSVWEFADISRARGLPLDKIIQDVADKAAQERIAAPSDTEGESASMPG